MEKREEHHAALLLCTFVLEGELHDCGEIVRIIRNKVANKFCLTKEMSKKISSFWHCWTLNGMFKLIFFRVLDILKFT